MRAGNAVHRTGSKARFTAADMAEWSGGEWEPHPPESVDGVSVDTRSLGPGEVFFALKGPRFDGHDFVAEACRKGAAAVVVAKSRRLTDAGHVPRLRVGDPAAAIFM